MKTSDYFAILVGTESFCYPLFEIFVPASNRKTAATDTELIRDVIFVWNRSAVNVSTYGMNHGMAPLPTALTCWGNGRFGSF